MWTDNASNVDLLFYDPYATIISEDAISSGIEPLTIGIFGLWGAGKSTLLHLIEEKYSGEDKILCVNINAWMFEGYEDAKTAVMEALLHSLEEEEKFDTTVKGLFKTLRKKVDLFKVGTTAVSALAPVVASAISGNPLPLVLSLPSNAKEAGEVISSMSQSLQKAKEEYLKDDSQDEETTVSTVSHFRTEFDEAISKTKMERIVVLVDDLDRCQPDRIIETLEAIKLFLAVPRMTFIIAADENVIQYSIKKKYPPMDDFRVELDKEYIEKLIQLPITVPELSEKDIQNYLTILVYQKHLSADDFDKFAAQLYNRRLLITEDVISKDLFDTVLKEIEGTIIDEEGFNNLIGVVLDIRPIVASTLKGNPRQAKRFLNTYVTKKRLADIYYPGEIDSKVLAKLLVLHKLDPALFDQLNTWNKEYDTENKKYREMREAIDKSSEEKTKEENAEFAKWHTPRIVKWVLCPPVELDKEPLNKYFYLTREILSTTVDIESDLSEAARKILNQFGKAQQGTILGVVEEMKKLSALDIDGIIKIIISKIKSGDIESYKYSLLFVAFPSYQMDIINAIKEASHKLTASDLPSYKAMFENNPTSMEPLLVWIKEQKLAKEPTLEKIRGKK